MAAANMESHKVAILPCGTVIEAMNGGSVDISRRPGPLLFLEKRLNDPCVDIWTAGGLKLSVDIDRLRNGLDSLETQCPHER